MHKLPLLALGVVGVFPQLEFAQLLGVELFSCFKVGWQRPGGFVEDAGIAQCEKGLVGVVAPNRMKDIGRSVAKGVPLIVPKVFDGKTAPWVPLEPIAVKSEESISANHDEIPIVHGGLGSVIQLVHPRDADVLQGLEVSNHPTAVTVEVEVALFLAGLTVVHVKPFATVPAVPTRLVRIQSVPNAVLKSESCVFRFCVLNQIGKLPKFSRLNAHPNIEWMIDFLRIQGGGDPQLGQGQKEANATPW